MLKSLKIKTYLKKILIIALLPLLYSCENYGCVESDDFGEYESYSFEIYPNNLEVLCKYDITKPIDSASQGSLFSAMYQRGDEGCIGKDKQIEKINCGLRIQTKCRFDPKSIEGAIQQPKDSGSNPKDFSEPSWKAIGGNVGIKIEEDSRILINAVGNVSLGDSSSKSIAKIDDANRTDFGQPESNSSQQVHASTNKSELNGNENLYINFWGKFTSNGQTLLYSDSQNDFVNQFTTNNKDISSNLLNNYHGGVYANGARRILAYFIPFPPKSQTYPGKFPLYLNPNSWYCLIDEGTKQLKCSLDDSKDDYISSEAVTFDPPDQAKSTDFNETYDKEFSVNNIEKGKNLRDNSGFIRFNGDGIIGSDTYYEAGNVNIVAIPIIHFPSNEAEHQVQSPAKKDYVLRFKLTGCTPSDNFKYKVGDSAYADVNGDPIFVNADKIESIFVKKNTTDSNTPITESCVFEAHFYGYHEILIDKSGFIEFGYPKDKFKTIAGPVLNPTISNECKLKFDIINQDGSKENANTPYQHELSTSVDKYFARKGQKIKFYPESWNGKWSVGGNEFQCGTGFYIKHTPRPAVFCSNKKLKEVIDINSDNSKDTGCLGYYDSTLDKLTGCQINIQNCSGSIYNSDSSGMNINFCPSQCINLEYFNQNCKPVCDPNTALCSPPTSCNPVLDTTKCNNSCDPAVTTCKTYESFATVEPYKTMVGSATSNISSIFNQTNCQKCIDSLKADATKTFFVDADALTQCYDLEEYTGTLAELNTAISSITEGTDKTGSEKDPLVILKDKKLKKLGSFNGDYGNLYPIEYKGSDSGPYKQFRMKNSAFVADSGYLKYIILNSDYTGSYDFVGTENSSSIITQSDLSISLQSVAEKVNGQNMTITLCDQSAAGGICESWDSEYDVTNTINPSRLGILSYNSAYINKNNYEFDTQGYLYRKTPTRTESPDLYAECSDSQSQNSPYLGADFICFKNPSNISNDLSKNNSYRLSFKIIDYEENNCKKATPENACSGNECDGVKMINPLWSGDEKSGGFCSLGDGDCKKKYYCVDKYANNSGKYIVTVRTKRKSQQSVSRFINSIMSPVLGQIDGFNIDKDLDYVQVDAINNDIATANAMLFGDVAKPQYLNETGTLDGGTKSLSERINDFKSLDTKIIGSAFAQSKEGVFEIDLNLNTDKCANDCVISYIAFAGYGKSNDSTKVNIDKEFKHSNPNLVMGYVRENCLLKSSCKFAVAFDTFGNPVAGKPEYDGEEKLSVSYIYSKSTKKLKQENLVKRLYTIIANNPVYKTILTLSVAMMFSFYGLGYLIGVSELKQSEIIDRLIKVAIIYVFTNPDFGWIWFEKFFVQGFKNGADFISFTMASIFDESDYIQSALRNNIFTDKSPLFHSADSVISLFISNEAVHKKIGALLFYKLFGIIYLFILYHAIFSYIYAVSNAVLLYLTAQVFTSILFMVGPIFFIFILFKQTKSFFDNWLNAIIGFALQQIFLVFTISLFNLLIYNIVKLTLGYRVCWDTVWKIDTLAGSNALLRFWTVNDAPSFLNQTQDLVFSSDSNKTTPSFSMILSLWSITLIMKTFVSSITDLAANLAGGIQASSLGSGVAQAMNKNIAEFGKKMNKLYQQSGAQKVMQNLDKRLFDSGALAKKERLTKKRERVNNKRLEQAMNKAGDKAVRDYKINNASEYSKKSDAEKKEELQKVKKQAMIDVAKKAGKSKNEIDQMMKEKKDGSSGSKSGILSKMKDAYNTIAPAIKSNDNIIAGLGRLAIDKVSNKISGGKNLDERSKNVETSMSKDDVKKAIKNIDGPEKRNEFVDSLKKDEGKIDISKSLTERAGDAIKKVVGRAPTGQEEYKANALKSFEKTAEKSNNDDKSKS